MFGIIHFFLNIENNLTYVFCKKNTKFKILKVKQNLKFNEQWFYFILNINSHNFVVYIVHKIYLIYLWNQSDILSFIIVLRNLQSIFQRKMVIIFSMLKTGTEDSHALVNLNPTVYIWEKLKDFEGGYNPVCYIESERLVNKT